MATATSAHQVAVAKASLTAALLRAADSQPCTRDDITTFHSSLDRALSSCTSTNIQTCKRWILTHVAASPARTASLGKFLAALAGSLDKRRKKLYLLYLLNDVLHHTTIHQPDGHRFADAVRPFLNQLYTAAVYPGAVKQRQKLLRLLGFWRERAYYPPDVVSKLEKLVNDIADAPVNSGTSATGASNKKDEPSMLLLPATHGDPSIPFYDLPAGNLLPHIPKNVVRPINARAVKPYQFTTITPSGSLSSAMQEFLAKVERAWNPASGATGEPDAVGGIDDNGDPHGGEAYYGWSKEFCEKMRKKKSDALAREREALERKSGRGRESGRYGSSNRRRSYSRSSSGSSRSSRSRSRSRSKTRDRYRDRRDRGRDRSRDHGRDRSSSPPRSRSGPAFKPFQPASSNDSSHPLPPSAPSHAPHGRPPARPAPQHQQQSKYQGVPPPPPPHQQMQQQPFIPFPPPPFPGQQQPGWIPPPLPPGPHQGAQQPFPMLTPEQLAQLQMGAAAMGWIPQPPPPFSQQPPPPSQYDQQGYPGMEKPMDPRRR